MNAVLNGLLAAAAAFLQSPAGQEKLASLLPTIMAGIQSLFDKIKADRQAGLDAEAQKAAMAQHIADLVSAAAKQAEADHAAHPDDSAFDQRIFRD